MGQYTCRLVTSCVMFCVAFSTICVGMFMEYWGTANAYGKSYTFWLDGRLSRFSEYEKMAFTSAMMGTIATALVLTGLCCLLSFVMMCADLCCKVTQCMTVIPKITMTAALLSGLFAECTCALFLIDVYAVDAKLFKTEPGDSYRYSFNYFYSTKFEVLPSYCFYLVAATGIWLMISGCINFGARHATRVGVDDQTELVRSVAGQQGPVPAGGVNPYPNPIIVGGYFPPPTAMGGQGFQGYPSTSMGYFPPQTGIPGARLVLTNTSTQTSLVDIKNVVKTEEAAKAAES